MLDRSRKRPRDANQLGKLIVDLATGAIDDVRKLHRVAEDGAHVIEFCRLDTLVKSAKPTAPAKPASRRNRTKGGGVNGRTTSRESNALPKPNGVAVAGSRGIG